MYVLYGDVISIKNHNESINSLLQNTFFMDYMVIKYYLLKSEVYETIINDAIKYEAYALISEEEYNKIFHHLCVMARNGTIYNNFQELD